MSPSDFKKLVAIASSIADRSSVNGFVPLSRLADEFRADVKFRPLFVEAMIAEPKDKNGRWLVLVDSETHAITENELKNENESRPLTVRVRNTIAHELAHTLGRRAGEFGFESGLSREELVHELESETERLSPALLIPIKTIETACQTTERFCVENLCALRDRLAVSSQVLVARFSLLQAQDGHPLRFNRNLAEIAFGVGTYANSNTPTLEFWPVFSNFTSFAPEFLLQLRAKQPVSVTELFSSPDFYLNRGSEFSVQSEINFGTPAHPTAEKAAVVFSVESIERTAGTPFLWMLKKI